MIKKLFFLGIVLSAFLCACTTEDSASEEVQASQDLPIGFNPYLGRTATTRSTIYNSKSDLGTIGVGVYAMYSKGEAFDPNTENTSYKYYYGREELTCNTTSFFKHNYMNNVHVWDKNNDGAWTYSPVRYWPNHSNEFISFLAYGPYQATAPTLYTKTVTETVTEGGTTTNVTSFESNGSNPVYLKYELGSDPKNHYDLMWNYNNTWNMQLTINYFNKDGEYGKDGSGITNYAQRNDGNKDDKDDKWSPADTETYPGSRSAKYYEVKLKMAHACARIAYTITSPALKNKDNFANDDDKESNNTIKINKVVFLGDAKSGVSESPKGVFTKSGYLNLTNTSKAGMWEGLSDEKVAFSFKDFYDGTYDNTSKPNIWTPGSSTTTNNIIKATKDDAGKVSVNTIGNSADGYLFIIPQNLDFDNQAEVNQFVNGKILTGKPLYCYVDYTVQYKDITDGTVKDGVNYQCYGFINKNFEAGKAYVIHIQIGSEDGGSTSFPQTQLNSIHFRVEADPWANEEETTVDAGFSDKTGGTTGKL